MDFLQKKKDILEKIEAYETIIIVRHVQPDGDCIGSSLGLRDILRESYPNKKIYSFGKSEASYLEFVGKEDICENTDIYRDSLIIAVDTANLNRIDDDDYKLGKEIIKIDHHLNVEEYGTICYVREDYPAASCIIVDFYETFKDKLKMPKSAAKALLTGIITDTGRFKFGLTSETLQLTATLLKHDLDLEKIYANLYIKDEGVLHLQGEVYNSFKTTKNGVSYIYITNEMREKYNLTYDEAASLVNSLDSIKGSLIWIAFIDKNDGTIRVRLRSRFVEVVEVGQRFGGGGHLHACGATVKSIEEMKELLEYADEVVKKYKATHEDWL